LHLTINPTSPLGKVNLRRRTQPNLIIV
jgi:hypothetical protein